MGTVKRTVQTLVIDVALVLVFVLVGRRSHEESSAIAGLTSTAWPFLVGTVVGWLVVRVWIHPMRTWPEGVGIWLSAVIIGMVLRAVSGQGTEVSFVIVTLLVLGVFLVGWRVVVGVVHRRVQRQRAAA